MRGTTKNTGRTWRKVAAAIVVAVLALAATPVAAQDTAPATLDVASWLDLGKLFDLVTDWLPAKTEPSEDTTTTTQSTEETIEPPTEEIQAEADPLG